MLNTGLREMPPIPALQNSICQEEALLQYAARAHIKMLTSSEDNQPGLLVTQGSWTIYSIFVPQLHLLKSGDYNTWPFFESHKNVVKFKQHNASESALKIAEFHRTPRYHYKQRAVILYG